MLHLAKMHAPVVAIHVETASKITGEKIEVRVSEGHGRGYLNLGLCNPKVPLPTLFLPPRRDEKLWYSLWPAHSHCSSSMESTHSN